jgi:hypothetical protein
VVQAEECLLHPEFNPQYHQKKKKKGKMRSFINKYLLRRYILGLVPVLRIP